MSQPQPVAIPGESLPSGSGRFAEHLTQRERVTTTEAVDPVRALPPDGANAGIIERVGSTHDPTR